MSGTAFNCPECGATARSPRVIPVGSLVKCPACSHVFRFGEATAAKPPARDSEPAAEEPPPRRRDDDDDYHRPRRRRDDDDDRVRARRDDGDYDDRPQGRRYEDDDDDDRPRRRRRKESGSRAGTGLAFAVVFILMLIGVAVGVLAYAFRSGTNNNEVTFRPPAVGIPGLGGGPGAGLGGFLGEGGFGDIIDEQGLNNSADNGPDEKAKLTKGAAALLTDATLTPDRPRRLIGPPPANAKQTIDGDEASATLARDVLARVKAATTMILCKHSDGRAGSGSGFFVGGDKVMTNAHVIGMLPPGSRNSQGIDVILNSGDSAKEARCVGHVLGVDHDHDLALLQVDKPDNKDVKFPEPLTIATSASLKETQSLWVFGFPLGEQLGKSITVSPARVSSFRRDSSGMRVQVHGGMEHGNSGGPVVDAGGQLVGVSVAKIEKTEINFAVAAEHVSDLLEGHLATLTVGRPTHKNGIYELPVTVTTRDPLKRVRGVKVDWWFGKAGQKVPAGRDNPPPGPARQKVVLTGKDGKFTGIIPLGTTLPEEGVLWLQAGHAGPTATEAVYYEGVAVEAIGGVEERPIKLEYRPRKANGELAVRSVDTVRFDTHDGGVHTAEINVAARMKEERRGQGQEGSWVFHDGFLSLDERVSVDGQGMDRSVSIMGHKSHVDKTTLDLKFSEAGKVTAGRPNFPLDVPDDAKRVLGGFAGRVARAIELASVACPSGELAPGQSWNEERKFPLHSPEGEMNLKLKIKYTYTGVRKLDGREVAQLTLAGDAVDVFLDDGPTPGKLHGYILIDVKTGMVSKANVVLDVTQQGQHFHGEQSDVAHTLEVRLQRE